SENQFVTGNNVRYDFTITQSMRQDILRFFYRIRDLLVLFIRGDIFFSFFNNKSASYRIKRRLIFFFFIPNSKSQTIGMERQELFIENDLFFRDKINRLFCTQPKLM